MCNAHASLLLSSPMHVHAGEDWPRYKYAVQVFIGEQRGEGVRCVRGCRGKGRGKGKEGGQRRVREASYPSGVHASVQKGYVPRICQC